MSDTIQFGPASTSISTPTPTTTNEKSPEPSLRLMLQESSVTGSIVSKLTSFELNTLVFEFTKLLAIHDLAFKTTDEEREKAQEMIDARDRRIAKDKDRNRYSNAYKVKSRGGKIRETIPSSTKPRGQRSSSDMSPKKQEQVLQQRLDDYLKENPGLDSDNDDDDDELDLFSGLDDDDE